MEESAPVQKARLDDRSAADLRAVYDRFREQVNTENQLYNQRIVWLVSMNAFLFATIGLILQAKFNPEISLSQTLLTFGAPVQDIVDGFLILFSLVGFSISMIGDRLIHNTNLVRLYILERWQAYTGQLGDVQDLHGYLSVEGGSGSSVEHKVLSSDNIPKIFIFTWVFLLIAVIALLANRHLSAVGFS